MVTLVVMITPLPPSQRNLYRQRVEELVFGYVSIYSNTVTMQLT